MEDVNIFGGYFGSPLMAALKGNHATIAELLLDRGIEVNHFSPKHGFALHCACTNRNKKLIQSILDHGADINAYNYKHGSALAAVVSSCNPSDPARLLKEQSAIVELLFCHEPRVRIRECDLLVAASFGGSHGQHFMRCFLAHDQSAVATEAVILKIIRTYNFFQVGDNILPLLLKHDGGLGTTPAMLKATRQVKLIKTLLEYKPLCRVTPETFERIIKYNQRNRECFELVELLLAYDPEVIVTEATIIAALGIDSPRQPSRSILKLLLDRNSELKVTDQMIEMVFDIDDMELLLQRRGKEQTISPDILKHVAETRHRKFTLPTLKEILEM